MSFTHAEQAVGDHRGATATAPTGLPLPDHAGPPARLSREPSTGGMPRRCGRGRLTATTGLRASEVAVEIGLIGLGKMGGNMAERLRRGGHTVVGYDRNAASPRDVGRLEELVQKLAKPRVVWVMVPVRRADPGDRPRARRTAGAPATSSSTAATPATPTTRCTPRCSPRRASVRRRRRLRRRLGPAERLRADGRRRRRRRRQGAAGVRHAQAVRGRLRARRQGRRRPLRQDGPQRHRVRDHAGVRRGLRAARDRPSWSPTCRTCSAAGPRAP